MTATTDPADNPLDRSVSLAKANGIVILFSIPLAVVMYSLFLIAAPHNKPIAWQPGDLALYAGSIVAGILLHELLHALGWVLFGGLPLSRIHFGFKLRTLTPYAHLKGPIAARPYRTGILLPLLVLGLPPYLIGLLLANQRVMVFGLFFTLAAGGDLLVLWLLRGVPGDARVEDHPTRAGCWVYRS